MGITLVLIVLMTITAVAIFVSRAKAAARQRRFEDAQAEARQWVDRLGGQIVQILARNDASKQALAEAAECYDAAGRLFQQARSPEQAERVGETALEGLAYVRAARIAMDLDPGLTVPGSKTRTGAGTVTGYRKVDINGQTYEISPQPGDNTPYYHPGGDVAGRPVPQGWYSIPWWKPAVIRGTWGLGAAAVFTGLFDGMDAVPHTEAWPSPESKMV
jgi:hypothetical protein